MAGSRINAALVGFGFSGSTFHAPFLNALGEYNLACVVSSNSEKVYRNLPRTPVIQDFHTILGDPDVDLVVITTPSATHYELGKAALEAGKHVVIEKPLTLRADEGQKLLQLAQQHQRILTVYHNRRWDGDFLTIQKLLAEKALGDIYLYEAHFHRYRPCPNPLRWKENESLGAGVLYDLGAHLLDQALQLFGLPDSVEGEILTQRPGAVADDYFHLTLKYGVRRVILRSSSLVSRPGPRYQVHGTRGSFLKSGADPQEQALMAGKNPLDGDWGQDVEENYGILATDKMTTRIPTLPGNYGIFYKALASAIRHNSAPPVLAEDACQVVRLIEACRGKRQESAGMKMLPIE